MKRRPVAAALAVALTTTIVGFSTAGSPALADAPAVSRAVQTVAYSASIPTIIPKWEWHWWGARVKFDKTQTKMLIASNGAVLGKAIGDIGGLFIGGAMADKYSDAFVDAGNCIQMSRPWGFLTWVPSTYGC